MGLQHGSAKTGAGSDNPPPSPAAPIDPAEAERCKVPDFAKAMGTRKNGSCTTTAGERLKRLTLSNPEDDNTMILNRRHLLSHMAVAILGLAAGPAWAAPPVIEIIAFAHPPVQSALKPREWLGRSGERDQSD